ncbi:MAG: chloride channel protein [Bacteroidetes bacterium]|nr:chloride channel protein [Bacteroidota bacterium]
MTKLLAKIRDIYFNLLLWRIKHISDKNFVIILGGVVGIVAGIAAVALKSVVHFIQGFLTGGFAVDYANILHFIYPLVGIILTVLLAKYLLRESLGHGITSILFAISKNSSIIGAVKMYSRMVTSAITVGFGGSVGLEAPIVVTGSAIGSNIAQTMHLNYKQKTLLIGCGAAGAISAIFNSPIAGVIFAVEVLLAEVTIAAFIPLLIASVFGQLISLMLLGEEILFSFQLKDPFAAADVPFYFLLGIACGLVSLYFTRCMYKIEDLISSIKGSFSKGVMGGIGLGLIIFLFPPIYGEGYDAIKLLLSEDGIGILNRSLFFNQIHSGLFLLLFMLGLIIMKPVATALTIGSGGSGGIFAPSLFLGGVTGFFFATSYNYLALGQMLSISNFTLVGMCGVMSGVLHAPLTAIFLIAEITGGYTLFVPLMLVSAISFITKTYFEKHSFYTKHLIERGDLIQYDKDRQVLSLIHLKKIIETDLALIKPEDSLGDLVNLVRQSKRNIFPVVNDNQELEGIVTLDDIREIMFDEESRQNVLVKSIMRNPPDKVSSHEKMQSVMNKFEKSGAWNLPVIDEGKYVGFVSKSRIFNAYRKKLISQTPE